MENTNKKYVTLSLIMSLYCVFTVVQNLFEMKTLGTSTFAFGGGGIMVSWASFMLMDISTELFGKKSTMRVYTVAGIINLLIVLLAQVVILLPGTYPEQNAAFTQIFSNGPRTAIASFIAFWFGNFVNMHIMVKMKDRANGSKSKLLLFLRAVVSTIFGQFIDNGLFAVLAFAPIGLSVFEMTWVDILTSVLFGTFCETLIESCFVPFITIPVTLTLQSKFINAED